MCPRSGLSRSSEMIRLCMLQVYVSVRVYMDHMSTAAAVGMSNTRMRGDRATQRREEEGGRYWAREREREREKRGREGEEGWIRMRILFIIFVTHVQVNNTLGYRSAAKINECPPPRVLSPKKRRKPHTYIYIYTELLSHEDATTRACHSAIVPISSSLSASAMRRSRSPGTRTSPLLCVAMPLSAAACACLLPAV